MNSKQLQQAQELLTAAINYDAAIHAAFVSTAKTVEVDLHYNGQSRRVTVPTYHYLLSQIEQLGKQVAQLQVDDDGSDVVQLLTQTSNLAMVYVQRRQHYVPSPKNARLVAYRKATAESLQLNADSLVLEVDLTDCKLPMDAQIAIISLDDAQPIRLPIMFKDVSANRVATVLSVKDQESIMIDYDDVLVGDKLAIHGDVYEVLAVKGANLTIKLDGIHARRPIKAGDHVYSVVEKPRSFIEVPITKLASKLSIQVQYMQLLSDKAYYDVSDMKFARHAETGQAISEMLATDSKADALKFASLASKALPSNIDEVLKNSVPTVLKTTVSQTNAHQYMHSALETMVKTNAVLVQAKQDIANIEQIIVNAGTSVGKETLQSYHDQLASAKNRYASAQASLASLNVSAQAVRPEYAVTLHCSPTDSAGMPIVQYIVRYQPLSFGVKDVKNDWSYIYSDKRSASLDGRLSHDIDDYSSLSSVQMPIKAYEQIAFQVAAVLAYGQPMLTVQTGWSELQFVQIPDNLLKEVSIDEMFKNAYEAKLYTNVHQAMEAAGVYRHIDPSAQFAHRAQDLQYDNDNTVYTKLQQLDKAIISLKSLQAGSALTVYVRYGSMFYLASNGGQVLITTPSYSSLVLDNAVDKQDALGSVASQEMQIIVVNDNQEAMFLHSLIPGSSANVLASDNPDFDALAIVDSQGEKQPTEGMLLYRIKSNAIGNKDLTIRQPEAYWKDLKHANAGFRPGAFGSNVPGSVSQKTALVVAKVGARPTAYLRNFDFDYPGIGIHEGFLVNGSPVHLPDNESAANAVLTDYAKSAYDTAGGFPTCKFTATNPGRGLLAEQHVQAQTLKHDSLVSISHFSPEHKYLSGRASRGAFLYLSPVMVHDMQLAPYGTSNAMQVQPNTKDSSTVVVPVTFQARMTDRLGLTDVSSKVMTASDGKLTMSDNGENFEYSKTIAVKIKTGIAAMSFDITVTMPLL